MEPEPSAREVAALALVVLGSVAVLPGALNRFVLPKWAVTTAGIAMAFRSPARGALPRSVALVLGAGTGILAVAALAGVAPVHQLLGVAPRYEGLVAATVYGGAVVTGARLLGPGRPSSTEPLLLRLLAGAAVAVALLALLETLGLRPLESDVTRPGSLLGNASDQGAWGVLVLGPLLCAAVRAPNRTSVVGAVAAAAAVVLSASRGALLGLLAVVVVLVLVLAEARLRRRLMAMAVGVLAVALAVPAVRERLLGSGFAGTTVEGRTLLWAESWSLYLQHPLLGVGPGGFGDAVRGIHGADWYAMSGADHPPDSPHSWPLQALLAGGPLLLAVVVVLGGLVVRAAWSRASDPDLLVPGLAAGLAGYATSLLFHFTGPGHTPLAGLFAGALLATPAVRRTARTAAERVVPLVAAVVVVVAGLGAVAEVPLRRAVVALHEGSTTEADELFDAARTLRFWDREVSAVAGHAFAVAGSTSGDPGQLALADRWLARRLASGGTSAAVLADLGTVREADGNLADAASLLDRALLLDPHNPDFLLRRGVVAARQEDWAAAESAFLAATRGAPDSPAPWGNLARVYEVTGRGEDARRAADRADDLGG